MTDFLEQLYRHKEKLKYWIRSLTNRSNIKYDMQFKWPDLQDITVLLYSHNNYTIHTVCQQY